jgi:hypothetical protein
MVAAKAAQASFVMATIMPMSTNTTIAICIQIQVGDMTAVQPTTPRTADRRRAVSARLSP